MSTEVSLVRVQIVQTPVQSYLTAIFGTVDALARTNELRAGNIRLAFKNDDFTCSNYASFVKGHGRNPETYLDTPSLAFPFTDPKPHQGIAPPLGNSLRINLELRLPS